MFKNLRRNKVANQNKNHSKHNKKLIICVLCISIIFIIIAIFLFVYWIKDNESSKDITDSILEDINISEIEDSENTELINPPSEDYSNDYWDFIKMPLISVDFDSLLRRNKDTVGWIKVNDTNINYPIVQANDNSYYLTRAFDGSFNQAGWIFADYRNNMKSFNRNTIIYGHSRLNQTMFASLKNVFDRSWYENKSNHVIRLSTPTENTMWQVFSVYTTEAESYYITTSFSNDQVYQKFLNTIQSRSIYNFNVNLSATDKILTLSTCNNTAGTGRIAVHARLIKREARK